MRTRVQIFVALTVLLAGLRTLPAHADSQRIYVRSIPDQATWLRYSRQIGSDRFGKFIIDVRTRDIYFIDVNTFKMHADFVFKVLLSDLEWTAENVREYNKNYERTKPRFILGYLTHHLKVDKMSFAFWEGDKIQPPEILRVHKKLNATFFRKQLPYRPDSPAQEALRRRVRRLGISVITNNDIYQQANYQAFNKGSAVGRLRVVPRGTPYENLLFDRHDIVVLQESYPDISPVAGILSSVFSTPLAHVNLRATSWGIPNASYVHAHRDYAKLAGKTVYFQVTDTGHTLREATAGETAEFERNRKRKRQLALPQANLSNARMAMLTRISVSDVGAYGAKTSNLGEIARHAYSLAQVPKGFGIPFYYYMRHIQSHGIDKRIASLLGDKTLKLDIKARKHALAALRQTIMAAPLEQAVLDAVYKRVRLKLGGKGVFVRSSTNAEDLPGFNGAGLYETVPNVHGKRQLGEAIKTVWASLWNLRAYEERDLFGIDHSGVYAGVLVQVGVNATAAGVLITDNLYNPEDEDSFTINAKWGLGIRVVEGTRVPEQIIFDTSNDGTKIISRSDDPVMLIFDDKGGIREVPNPHKGVILSEPRAKRLAQAVKQFMPLFDPLTPLDVEWLFEGDKVWIVQARPYVTAQR